MNAGKSIELLKVAHNYEEQGKKVLVFTSALDNRYGVGKVSSRIGLSREAIPVDKDTPIFQIAEDESPNIVLVDEAHMLTKDNILSLILIVDVLNIPVIAFGLKNDYKGELFEGSEALLIFADKLEEVKSLCVYCNRKATMVLKFKDGKPVYDGEQIEIGGNDTYKSVCRKHWFDPVLDGGE